MKDLKQLSSERLEYRGFTESDYDDLNEILGNEEVCRYLPVSGVYTKEQVQRVLNYFIKTFVIEEKNLHYIVTLKGTDTVIGYCGCSYIKEFECNEIEYFLKPQFFQKGYASEIAFKMKEVASSLGLKHLVGLADINNIPSQKVLEKIGYQYIDVRILWGSTLKYYQLAL